MTNKITGFHIEPTNICTLKCEGCARTRFIDQWPQHWQNHSINVDGLMKFLDIDLTGLRILLCGVYGDPIYHSDFHNLLQQLKDRGSHISIVTNGSYKTAEWWKTTADILTKDDKIVFSIDGLPDNFTKYRKNADWESIKIGIDSMVESDCRTIWKFIPFSFNQTNIATAQALATDLGIDEFKVEYSDRFDEKTQYLIPDHRLLGGNYGLRNEFKQGETLATNPRCYNGKEHFISASGFYSPCGYINDHRFYYKTIFGKNKTMFDISKTNYSNLMQQSEVVEFYQSLPQSPTAACQFNCPSSKIDVKIH